MTSNGENEEHTDHGFGTQDPAEQEISCRACPVVILRNPYKVEKFKTSTLRIGTWNVRSWYESGRVHNTIKEMIRLNIDIMGVSETRWPNSGEIAIRDHIVFYSGNNDPLHWNGVGIIINKMLKPYVRSFVPYSDRMALIQLNSTPRNINIIQIYAPTADKDDDVIEDFYEQLSQLMKYTKSNEVTMINGDFNAKVGRGREDDIIGDYGLGERNQRGDRLVEFCREKKLVVCNTLFRLPTRRIYTWRSPADTKDRIVRNQIDYVTIDKRFRNSIMSAKTYPGADIASDHNPVICQLKVRLKRVSSARSSKRMDMRRLQDPT
ncbi:craniofacial development protein 2-like [Harmonia axyridis]|uniref:craniofacial development protein 2-like n=1 Tax=Harmonia axyridis TaxID=115357 RepID=UPI001E277ADB|nr:craniofacial development protein 2-like [Harmonia axyridis]